MGGIFGRLFVSESRLSGKLKKKHDISMFLLDDFDIILGDVGLARKRAKSGCIFINTFALVMQPEVVRAVTKWLWEFHEWLFGKLVNGEIGRTCDVCRGEKLIL